MPFVGSCKTLGSLFKSMPCADRSRIRIDPCYTYTIGLSGTSMMNTSQVNPGGYMCTVRCTPKESSQGLHFCHTNSPETTLFLMIARKDPSPLSRLLYTAPATKSAA